MNYYEIIKLIERICYKHPFVKSFFIDKYSLVGKEDNIEYGVISLLPQTHNIGEHTSEYNFKMIYADRLVDDNDLQLQSIAIDTLVEICNGIKMASDLDLDIDFNIDVFSHQFADECSGAIITFKLTTRSKLGSCEWLEECNE